MISHPPIFLLHDIDKDGTKFIDSSHYFCMNCHVVVRNYTCEHCSNSDKNYKHRLSKQVCNRMGYILDTNIF